MRTVAKIGNVVLSREKMVAGGLDLNQQPPGYEPF